MYFRHVEDAAAPAAVAASELTRRQFLRFTTLAGSGLTLGILLPGCGTGPGGAGSAAGAASGPLAMPFLRIAPDNTVTVISKHLEAGQGVWTGLSAIVAEELDASWDQMRVESAPAKVPLYRNLAFVPLGRASSSPGVPPLLRTPGSSCARQAPRRAPCWWPPPPGSGVCRRSYQREPGSDLAHRPQAGRQRSVSSPAVRRNNPCQRR